MMRFRTSVVSAALLTIFAAGLAAQKKPETSSAKVLALENKWTDAYKLKDVTSMNSLLNEDVIVTVEDGGIYSKTGYIAHVSDTNVHVDVAEIGDVKIRMHGNVAVVTGGYHEKGTSKGKPYEYRDRFTDVWMNVAGAWQLIASHYSVRTREWEQRELSTSARRILVHNPEGDSCTATIAEKSFRKTPIFAPIAADGWERP